MTIRSVAVLGAGVMGAQIAAHCANAGLRVLLADLTADQAAAGLERARRLSPDPFFTRDAWSLVETSDLGALWPRLPFQDWVVEAVVERLDVKVDLLAKVDAARRNDSVVSTNTSGIPIAALAAGRSDRFRRHFLGTHFFNPPRYLHLLEVVPARDTDASVLDAMRQFADERLGKGVVVAKDAPGFIGNRLALFELARILRLVASGDYSIDEVDAITGPAIGRPKSATFRTVDLAGLDVLRHVARDLRARLPGPDAPAFDMPPFVGRMLAAGHVGEKVGRGFYRKVSRVDGPSEIQVLDVTALEYIPTRTPTWPSLAAAESVADLGARVRRLFAGDDRVGRFLRSTLAPTLVYAARVLPEIASSVDDVDRVMRWGFGWERGPFELIDAIGIGTVLEATAAAAPELLQPLPDLLIAAQRTGHAREGLVPAAAPDLAILRTARERQRVVRSNPGASLVDLGDGVLAVEFHSKMNTLGVDAIEMLHAGVDEAARHFAALVVGNEATHFSAGANLALVLLEAQDENWDELDAMVGRFQHAVTALRFADVPVVVAPAGLTIGGGCEIALHADRVQAAAESYIGLVEVGVGLIPAGGGTKELTARAAETAGGGDLLPALRTAFETIAFARTSTSGPDAASLGFLRPVDGVTMNRERLTADAKAVALRRVREGYQPGLPRMAVRVGGDSVLAPLKLGIHLASRAGRISDYDARLGRALATVMAGGNLPHETTVPESHLLDLEREALLSLLGEVKTQERIAHTLKTGKPLRN
jgi:3-hydroxyacyl-CoA dehydrogenase